MVGGYALASALFLGNTWVAAIEEVPHNLVQTSLGWLWDMLCIISYQRREIRRWS